MNPDSLKSNLSRGTYYLVVGEDFMSLLQSSGFEIVSYGQASNNWKTIYSVSHNTQIPTIEFIGPSDIFLEELRFEITYDPWEKMVRLKIDPSCITAEIFQVDIVNLVASLLGSHFVWGRRRENLDDEDLNEIKEYIGEKEYWL